MICLLIIHLRERESKCTTNKLTNLSDSQYSWEVTDNSEGDGDTFIPHWRVNWRPLGCSQLTLEDALTTRALFSGLCTAGFVCFPFTKLAVTSLSRYPPIASWAPALPKIPVCTFYFALLPACKFCPYSCPWANGLTVPLPPISAILTVDIFFWAGLGGSVP